ncbi:hypothetical protein CMI42_04600 [Candidatus Pacearchaeota archaeon]|nr:hypothetical protein [Candidatus Pacearchaeota archaeon]|tara:strand:+ start:523 stop:1284 length:762 start_codon:yes stop_codon:yes gene_type:complete
MKKVFVSFVLLLLVLSSMSFVLGQEEVKASDLLQGGESAGKYAAEATHGFFSFMFSNDTGGVAWGTAFFLGILLFLIVWKVIPLVFGDHKFWNFFISIVITVLAMYAIPDDIYGVINANYGIMGATILSSIPFLITLVLSVTVRNQLVARLIWTWFTVYYFMFYIYLSIPLFQQEGEWVLWNANAVPSTLPYLIATIFGLILILFVPSVRGLVFKGKMGALEESADKIIQRGGLLHNLQKEELEVSYGDGGGI